MMMMLLLLFMLLFYGCSCAAVVEDSSPSSLCQFLFLLYALCLFEVLAFPAFFSGCGDSSYLVAKKKRGEEEESSVELTYINLS